MVHTRGQPRFAEGDRVLCYEPDATKAQVLYEAKVLENAERKDKNGRRTIECLVHFQGWNSSWDRYVAEEQILEYNEANRRLQRTLAEKLLPPGVVDRRRYSFAEGQSQGSSVAGSAAPSEPDSGPEDQSEQETAVPTSVPIEVPPPLRRRLDDDYYFVNKYHKLPALPCDTTVADLLEAYVLHWHQTHRHAAAAGARTKVKDQSWDSAVRSLNLCKEVVDGLRITFDHVLELQLLYAAEREQHSRLMQATSAAGHERTRHASSHSDKTDESVSRRTRLRSRRSQLAQEAESADDAESADGGGSSEEEQPDAKRRLFSVDSTTTTASELAAWSVLPPSELHRNPPLPCCVYGATHLLRLIAVLPDILLQMHLTERKLNLVVHHVTLLLHFIQENSDQLFHRSQYR